MSTEEPNEPEARISFNDTEIVDQTINRVMQTSPPNIGWMTSELAQKLLSAHGSARTLMMMSLLRNGMPQDQAKEQADMQAPLLMFDLGLRVGKEIVASTSLEPMLQAQRAVTAEQARYLDAIDQWSEDERALMFGPAPD